MANCILANDAMFEQFLQNAGMVEALCGVMQSRLVAYTPLERDGPAQTTSFDANSLVASQPETFKS